MTIFIRDSKAYKKKNEKTRVGRTECISEREEGEVLDEFSLSVWSHITRTNMARPVNTPHGSSALAFLSALQNAMIENVNVMRRLGDSKGGASLKKIVRLPRNTNERLLLRLVDIYQ